MAAEEEVRIRAAAENDLSIIHTMIEALAQHLTLSHELVVDGSDLHDALFGSQPKAEVLLAELGDNVAGFALFYGNYSTFRGQCGLHLEDLYVSPDWRGRGIGRRLLAYLASLTIERGCRRLEWWVKASDIQAVEFYDMLGAMAKDEWTVYRLSGGPLKKLAGEIFDE